MADTIVTVNIYAKTANTDNGWVPAPVAKQSPVLNYDADLDTTLSLLNFPNVFIYDAGTGQVINKSNLQTYYPEYNPGGGGGGGGGGTTNYSDLTNKPKINNVTLQGNKSLSDIGATSADEVYKKSEVDTALDNKVTKETGKGLSTNDFTNDALTKLSGIEPDAEVNVQSDWNQTDTEADDFIKNKPTLATVATSGDYNDLDNKPTIPDAQVNSDWNSESGVSQILNKPTLGTAASLDMDAALDSASTNPVQNKAVQAPIARLIDAGSKNLCELTESSGSINEVTFDINKSTGVVTATGTSTSESGKLVSKITLPSGEYVFSASEAPSSTTQDAYIMVEGTTTVIARDSGTNSHFTLATDTSVRVYCRTRSTISSAVFRPMICKEEDHKISPEFVPHAKSNYELTRDVELIPSLVDRGAKNIFPYGDLTGITTNFRDEPLVLPKGAYKLIFHESATSGSFAVRMKDASGNSIFYTTESNANTDHAYDVELSVDSATITIYSSVSNDFTNIMICKKSDYDMSPTVQPHALDNPELTKRTDILPSLVDAGAKNIADMSKTSFTSLTKGGVTVTLSGDTFTSSGTSTSDDNNFFNVFYVDLSTVLIPSGKWVAVLEGTGIENFRIEEFDSYNGTALKGEFGKPFHFEIHTGVTVSYLRITTKPNTLCDGNFKLMICKEEDYSISTNVVPHAKSNYELTQAVEPIPGLVDRCAKNVFDLEGSTVTLPINTTVTKNADGSVVVKSTDGGGVRIVRCTVNLQSGVTYRLSGCPSGGGANTYALDVRDGSNNHNQVPNTFDIGSGSESFTVPTSGIYYLSARFADGYTTPSEGVTFYPMICTAADYKASPAFEPYAPSNRELYESKADRSQVFGAGTKLATNADLNSVTTHGLYYTDTQALTNSLSNCPVTNTLLMLKVSFGTSTILQELQPVGSAQVANRYVRTYGSGAWTSWYKFEGTAVT